jgi:hypothetical protein
MEKVVSYGSEMVMIQKIILMIGWLQCVISVMQRLTGKKTNSINQYLEGGRIQNMDILNEEP